MPIDDRLADRVRRLLANRSDVVEKRMFGGLAFMVRGHMACGIVADRLMVRLDPAVAETLLTRPHVRPMDFTGRPLRGFLYVEGAGLATGPALRAWVARAVAHAEALPPRMGGKGAVRRSR